VALEVLTARTVVGEAVVSGAVAGGSVEVVEARVVSGADVETGTVVLTAGGNVEVVREVVAVELGAVGTVLEGEARRELDVLGAETATGAAVTLLSAYANPPNPHNAPTVENAAKRTVGALVT
jgi:hypothetical protein